jgi:acetyl-CoA acyltransferase
MEEAMAEAYIVSAVRTAVGKAPRGTLRNSRPDDLAAAVIREAITRVPGLQDADIEDVILGCAMPEAEQGMNVARIAMLRAGLPVGTSAFTINRFCSSGLQAIALAAERIIAGFAHAIVAGGTESMSMVPMSGNKFSPNPYLVDNAPDTYLAMGLTAENLAQKYAIPREEADRFAYLSHMKAVAAISEGRFKEEIVPVPVQVETPGTDGNHPSIDEITFAIDEGPRPDTSPEALAKLKPVFHARGTITAGNASQTSDGAAACVVMSGERVRESGARPLARFIAFATGGVPPEIMGIGPAVAIPKALKIAGLRLSDMDLIELNEAFAVQALAVIREVGMDSERVNVNGGAVALGHPLGCTGAKLTATLLSEMRRRGSRYGMVTMCVGGGMGAAGIFELVG